MTTDAQGSGPWPLDLEGREVRDATGARLGTVSTVWSPEAGGDPDWLTVRLVAGSAAAGDDGPAATEAGTEERMVPLAGASLEDGAVVLPHDAATVRAAPGVGGAGHLAASDEAQLAAHYDLGYRTAESETGLPTVGLPPAAPG
ncbi:PRC-barrel domain-containing protein [Vallicoccus soli]|uniref:PRC-barrel domain containing protein n=1 Tax=Vallicoccus soli TaxID=2339232 RepID=A0A3A3Z3Z7_9ACTN|nr:PRC-barrel domain-containing protein [Vallicoccus soli]RJK95267.1 PRC-barrel domain containing protein [Vallicoccus soli]